MENLGTFLGLIVVMGLIIGFALAFSRPSRSLSRDGQKNWIPPKEGDEFVPSPASRNPVKSVVVSVKKVEDRGDGTAWVIRVRAPGGRETTNNHRANGRVRYWNSPDE
ncbi:hypothetical protein COB52_01110 [Candidatus Kaiserbacteria bacterium]|nr:MAG: hypothetical protein COB52_01110 [Candidatus Kaiserbacteria bacterium]